jgi:hypothetical protein
MANKKKTPKMAFSPEERQLMINQMTLNTNPEQLEKARQVASILAEDEEQKDEAFIALTFYYSAAENEDELNALLDSMRLG